MDTQSNSDSGGFDGESLVLLHPSSEKSKWSRSRLIDALLCRPKNLSSRSIGFSLFLSFLFFSLLVLLCASMGTYVISTAFYNHYHHHKSSSSSGSHHDRNAFNDRPQFHLMPPSGWMNDPDGLVFYDNLYHVFFQYNSGTSWDSDPIAWAHATSSDLLYWTILPVALTPSPGYYDAAGCWSGSALPVDGGLNLYYTGVVSDGQGWFTEVQLMASSNGDGDAQVFVKAADNPILASPPPEIADISGWRDPSTPWLDSTGHYQMLIGAGIQNAAGLALRYTSKDAGKSWTYVGIFFQGDSSVPGTGDMWECPDLVKLGDSNENGWALIVGNNATQTQMYLVGTYDPSDEQSAFQPLRGASTNFAFSHPSMGESYAGKTFQSQPQPQGHKHKHSSHSLLDNGPVQFVWLPEARPAAVNAEEHWAGVMSLPRVLSLTHAQTVGIMPLPNIRLLRSGTESVTLNTDQIKDGNILFSSDQCEIQMKMSWNKQSMPKSGHLGLRILSSYSEKVVGTLIYFDFEQQACVLDRKNSRPSHSAAGYNLEQIVVDPCWFNGTDIESGIMKMVVFVDHSVVEAFFLEGLANINGRVYPLHDTDINISVYYSENLATHFLPDTIQLDFFSMASIWTTHPSTHSSVNNP
jgi:beta-fructofuranosidase